MVLIIQEPRAHQPEGQEIVPFEDLVDFGDGEKNVAFLIKKTYEKKAHRGKANLIQAPEKFGKAIRMQAELFPADPPSEPFELTAGAAPFVVLSYCDDTDGGRGEERMWQIANFLHRHGIPSYNGLQGQASEEWNREWRSKMHNAGLVVALVSACLLYTSDAADE